MYLLTVAWSTIEELKEAAKSILIGLAKFCLIKPISDNLNIQLINKM